MSNGQTHEVSGIAAAASICILYVARQVWGVGSGGSIVLQLSERGQHAASIMASVVGGDATRTITRFLFFSCYY